MFLEFEISIDEISSSPHCVSLLQLCPICQEIPGQAMLTRCGHVFCSNCLHGYMKSKGKHSCPVCRAPVVFKVSG